ncbi:MAG: type II secretion system F family protein, partial [Candidatus Omnitrophota bacterium]|nr:type II secretion system F family protein [Candidatus Omnitrophota bacterium]
MDLSKYISSISIRKKVGTKSLVVFTKQLSTLIAAGLPLVKALKTLHDQLDASFFKDIIKSLADEVESGTNFSEALSRFPNVFPGYYSNMIKAGEMGGMLEGILKRLAEFLDKSQKLKDKVKSALMYPAFVMLVAVMILVMLMIFVIPTFTNMFSELGGALPLPTKILITTSDIVRTTWYLIPLIPVLVMFLFKLL